MNLRPAPLSKVGHGVFGCVRVHTELRFQAGKKGFRRREMARFLTRVELPEKIHDVRLRQERVNLELNLRLMRAHGVRWGKRESWPGVSPPRLLLGWILITFAQNSHFTVPSSSTGVLLLRPQFLQVQFRLAASMTHPLSRRRPATGATQRARVGRRGDRRPSAYHGPDLETRREWGLIFFIHYRTGQNESRETKQLTFGPALARARRVTSFCPAGQLRRGPVPSWSSLSSWNPRRNKVPARLPTAPQERRACGSTILREIAAHCLTELALRRIGEGCHRTSSDVAFDNPWGGPWRLPSVCASGTHLFCRS